MIQWIIYFTVAGITGIVLIVGTIYEKKERKEIIKRERKNNGKDI